MQDHGILIYLDYHAGQYIGSPLIYLLPTGIIIQTTSQACTIGVICGSGGNFKNLIDRPFIGRFACFATLNS